MSTYCGLHVHTNAKDSVVADIEEYAAINHRPRVVQTTKAKTLGQLYGEEFLCSETQQPTKFALITEQPGWLTIHYNSFLPLRELATDISRRLDTVAILVKAQSVSGAYYLAVFRAGEHLRTIEFADGEWLRQEGTPLPFEPSPLGKNISEEGEEPYYWFGEAPVREYCEHLGLKLWTHAWIQMENPQWTIVKV
jgi:hypothetical protein